MAITDRWIVWSSWFLLNTSSPLDLKQRLTTTERLALDPTTQARKGIRVFDTDLEKWCELVWTDPSISSNRELTWNVEVRTILDTSPYIAWEYEYIIVTNTSGDTTISLPPANNVEKIRVKKFTGEDVLTSTIVPDGSDLIDWFTSATINIDRTMYTLTAINGDWYLGD